MLRLRLPIVLLLMAGMTGTALAGKKKAPAGPSLQQGDPPPGNAMALSMPQARVMLREAIKKKYVGPVKFHIVFSNYIADLSEVTSFHIGADGFDLVAPFTWQGKHNDGKYSVKFRGEKNYLQTYSFKYGERFYAVLVPGQGPLGWGGMAGTLPLQFIWSDEADAQKFSEAFNRLLYAAFHGSANPDEEFAKFSAAAKSWRENPNKPPLSPEVDRHRILAENAIQEKNLDAAIEHYEAGLELQPMWPQGWFNAAMIYAEQQDYADAAGRMKHYLELVPDAPDAKAAREQMIIWDEKAKQAEGMTPAGVVENRRGQ